MRNVTSYMAVPFSSASTTLTVLNMLGGDVLAPTRLHRVTVSVRAACVLVKFSIRHELAKVFLVLAHSGYGG